MSPPAHAAPPIAREEPSGKRDEYAATVVAARARAEGLVAEMSLEEKVGLVSSYFPLLSPRAEELKMTPSSGFNPGLPRLGIPPLRINDASLGVANVLNARKDDTATALPSSLATASAFDPELAYAGGAAIGAEARAKTFNMLLAGGMNLTRDPWAGRNFEYLGEDPLLAGVMAGASVQGVQSNKIASTLKHLALNAQETGRMVMDARIDRAALRESDLLAFEIALEIGRPASVMTAYNKVNGEYAGEHAELINGVLKGDWAFPGWVMSDWGAVHSTAKAAMAGLDQESGLELDQTLNGAIFFTDRLLDAVLDQSVPESRVDDMVARILVGMILTGAMDEPVPKTPQQIDHQAGAWVAQRIAETGVVLLRNEGGLLPLSRDVRRIVVIGGHADVGVPSGGGSSQVRSVGGAPIERRLTSGDGAWFCRETYHASSPVLALRALAPEVQIDFVQGRDLAEAALAAAAADVAVVFAVQWRSEAMDAETLALPDAQDELIAAVASANPNTVVVLETGGPVLMPWLDQTPAVLAAWYPGQRGGEAIARILFGEVNPSGRLPITFPATEIQAPRPKPGGLAELKDRDARKAAGERRAAIAPFSVDYVEGANVGYRWYEATDQEPLFPFGHGLSYTSFAYSDLDLAAAPQAVSVTVSNTGVRSGADVVQVYVLAADSAGVETWRLAGFARVELDAGQSRRLSVPLETRAFSRWDEAARCWRRHSGPLRIAVARSARTRDLEGEVSSPGSP